MDFHYLPDMGIILEAEANLTAQNQITIPAVVRKVLHLRGGQSRIKFQILPDEGRVMVIRVENPTTEKQLDPALKPFLALLEKDILQHPQRITPFPARLLKKARSLVKSIEVNLHAPLTGKD